MLGSVLEHYEAFGSISEIWGVLGNVRDYQKLLESIRE